MMALLLQLYNSQGLVHNAVLSIREDKNGTLWFATMGGVSRYDGTGFKTFTTEQGLADNYVMNITEDENRNIWFGTIGGGIADTMEMVLTHLLAGRD
jgi:ligand-binding sensor domain-containing protein